MVWEVDASGSRSCPVVEFGINGAEHSGSAVRAFVDLLKIIRILLFLTAPHTA
jgi:hypothetical protein